MAASHQDIELFNDSFERCNAHPDFLKRFYDIFLSSSPEIAEKFKNTDFKKQRRLLKSSLYLLLFAAEGKPEGITHLQRIAELHGPTNLNIAAYMYDIWMDSLLKAVKEFDPGYSPAVDKAWRNALSAGFDYLKQRSSD